MGHSPIQILLLDITPTASFPLLAIYKFIGRFFGQTLKDSQFSLSSNIFCIIQPCPILIISYKYEGCQNVLYSYKLVNVYTLAPVLII